MMDDAKEQGPPEPSVWVKRFVGGVKAGGHILDVACGSGRHLKLALSRGYRATGIDRDISRAAELGEHGGLTLVGTDLERGQPFPYEGRTFDGVIVVNYLWRPILPAIVKCVARDGLLIYETFAQGQERRGRPENPDFLLAPNELIEAVSSHLVVICYETGVAAGSKPRVVQRIAACGRGHPWAECAPVLAG
ncbi:MAG: class I SAM-dependent methyltransferase [Pseudomonadota bacterium]|nr:class I SAM-dependent methyltransferase [Pseudomonadota bacterium]